MIITIDGPVASGKSSVAHIVAMKLGYYYISSGLLFRGLAYLLINHRIYSEKGLASPLPEHLAEYLDPSRFVYRYDDVRGIGQIYFDSADITPYLSDYLIGKAASLLGTNGEVRGHMDDLQRNIARQFDVVVDGRDAGSHVFPDAEHKFYLTAPVEIRAQRWMNDKKRNIKEVSNLEEAIEFITERDTADKSRKLAPLTIPRGAIIINVADKSVEEVAQQIIMSL